MKKFLIFILIATMLLSLFACNNGETSTEAPTQKETDSATEKPTNKPTDAPTKVPTSEPTEKQTQAPTSEPTELPIQSVTNEPTEEPTQVPTIMPTEVPTQVPTQAPTTMPTEMPTTMPTEMPTTVPTEVPTHEPTTAPTEKPTEAQTTDPSEKETDEMQTEVVYDDIASVGIYDKYDLDSYMSPIWSGKVVHNETVMFVGIDDKASLLYDADRILSVKSYDLSIEYVQGIDYDYVDGKLVLLEGTRIPYVPLETYYSVLDPEFPYLSTMYNGKVTQTMWGDGTAMTKWQVAVTYKHSDTWEGKEIESYEDRFADFIKKLENGEDVTVFFYGDSITTGATSSQSRPPYAPSYPRMFVQYVAKQYGYTVKYIDTYSNTNLTNGKPAGGGAHPDSVFGTNGTITYINTAVGGWSTQNGLDNIREYVLNYIDAYGCDLFVLAFGMNNGSSTADTVVNLMKQILRGVTKYDDDANIVLVSTMIPNPEAVRNSADKYFCNGNQATFEEKMYPLADALNKSNKGGCAVAPMTSVSQYIHSQKRYRDTTGNNVNHPSDFLARAYAQVIYQTVFGYENYPSGPVDIGEVPVVDANYNAKVEIGGNALYLDGKAGTENANFASCVRLEATNGGYFMYHVVGGAKEYINQNKNGEIEYSGSGETVWTYNATLKAMVCDVAGLAVSLVKPEICIHSLVTSGDSHVREACVRCGVGSETVPHEFFERITVNPDGSSVHEEICSGCGYIKSSYTTEAPVEPEKPETDKNVSASVGIYDKFDLDSYMTPIWDGKVVHNETVLFVGPDDTPALLYAPDRIISVRSYDLSIEYIEGVDFEIVDNRIVRLEGSRIPYMPLETYYSVLNDKPYLSTLVNGVITPTIYGEGDTMCLWQIAITYKHSGTWEGPDLNAYTDRFAGLIEKLEKGEDVTFHFYGDSITTGANSSESIGKAPYMPSWARMFTMYVAKQYGYTVKFVDSYSDANLTAGKTAGGGAHKDIVYGTNGIITYVNTAVGGWNTQQGRDNFDAYVKAYVEKYGCDLFILAFGMNNGGSAADQVCGYLDEIVVKMEACAPEADVLLVSTMLPNPEAVRNNNDPYFNGNQSTFEEKMIPLAEQINDRGTNCALAPMTSMTKHLYTIKRFRDTTGNNVNHPSDFVIRLYAQTLFQTVFGFENYGEDEVELENKPVEDANFNAQMSVSGNTVYLDGASGTNNINYAVCVRFEEIEGGYYMYYVKGHGIVYINVENGSIVYSETATSVWAYDESLGAMVSGECAVTLSAPEICLHPVIAGEVSHGREACVRCGVEATDEVHAMVDTKTVNPDGSVTYSSSCEICGKVGRSNTIPANVIYYSGADTYKSPIFYLLNKELGEENDIAFTRVTATPGAHAHELHWIDQNNAPHNDYSGNQLDTKGLRYLVIRLRASHAEINMEFKYRLLASSIGHYVVPTLKADEWVTYVLDLKALGGANYATLEDGTYTMQYFKMYFDKFDHLENAYVDFAYLALCDSFEQIAMIANSETVQMMTTSGSTTEVRSDGTCIGEHSLTESVEGNTHSVVCTVCGKVIATKTLPDGLNIYTGAYTLSNNANGANLINYAEVIEDEDGIYCRIYGGASHSTNNYNEFTVYQNSSASLVTGQYLVIRYRVGQNELGQNQFTIFAGTEASAPNSENQHVTLTPGATVEDGQWHTAVIDMSQMAHNTAFERGFISDDDGLYRARFVCIRPFWPNYGNRSDEGDYTDIAYAAICDSVEEAEALIGDGSYEYYTDSSTPTVVDVAQ